ncbi:hypothetical protein M422DRAFT_782182 [Sphaerobolus stellatus SS14]|uniref:Uncharacterized protein n=1 Tax=Sphaerobolus stellatus (strain SS14) TaxID=990650 RepID=A0A0C9VGD5_SPHS4|nr:hypothetical protein M422DRAFT_782182 [Sphaerobolus stellatus SS14]
MLYLPWYYRLIPTPLIIPRDSASSFLFPFFFHFSHCFLPSLFLLARWFFSPLGNSFGVPRPSTRISQALYACMVSTCSLSGSWTAITFKIYPLFPSNCRLCSPSFSGFAPRYPHVRS